MTIKKLLKRNYEKLYLSAKSKQKETEEIEAKGDQFMISHKSEQLDKGSTMIDDASASRMSQIHQNSFFNTCDKIYLPISFLRFKTENGLNDVAKGGLEVRVSEDG